MDEPTPDALAEETRALLGPSWTPGFDDDVASLSRDPQEPLEPWESADDPPFTRCAVMMALQWTVGRQLAAGAASDVRRVLDHVERLLERFPERPMTGLWDSSMWNDVVVCFLESLLPVEDPGQSDLVVPHLGPVARRVAAEHAWIPEQNSDD